MTVIYFLLASLVLFEELVPDSKIDTRPIIKKIGSWTIFFGCLLGICGKASIFVPLGTLLYVVSNVWSAFVVRQERRASDRRAHG